MGQVGGWQIGADGYAERGCYAATQYADGTVLALGIDPVRESVYFVLGNAAWQSLESGRAYPIRFVFDGAQPYDGELTAVSGNGRVLLIHAQVSPEFVRDFAERTSVRIYYRGSQVTRLSLRDTYAALSEVGKCQQEMSAAGSGGNRDTRVAGDPFSR